MATDWAAISDEVRRRLEAGPAQPMGEDDFTDLALRVFAHQYARCRAYRGFCDARGASPASVERWQDVPAVPTEGFKHVRLLSADAAEAEFVTSGTSRGRERRGRHPVASLALYRSAALGSFATYLLPKGERLPLLSLIPSPEAAPDSSLSYMTGAVAASLAGRTRWLGERRGPVELDGLVRAVEELTAGHTPLLLMSTSFALVHVLDALAGAGRRMHLPEGTRVMETGGFKGRSREVSPTELYEAMTERLGVPGYAVVNEYGMTELLSQLYQPTLVRREDGARRHVPPPWLRVRALDPHSLEPVEPGAAGLLAFYDLANVGSVSHVLTEDMGDVTADGVRLLGRAPGSELRGCSLAVEELLSARESGR